MWAQSARDVGKIIATARRSRGLSQAELARAVGSTQAWVSAVERGKETAQIGKVLRLLSYLQVRLAVVQAPWLTEQPLGVAEPTVALADVLDALSENAESRKMKP